MIKKFLKILKARNSSPYMIAEIGNNHNGSVKLAKQLIIEAKKCGADCVKFQTFSTKSLFSKKSFIKNKKLKYQSDKYTLDLKTFKTLKNFAKKQKIEFTATPFSKLEVDFLVNTLKIKLIKIASMDLNNYPLIDYIAKKKIPILISTGFGSKIEIKKAISILKRNKAKFIILHCVSEYPPNNKNLNLLRIKEFEKIFSCPVGFSDHTIGTLTSITALALGAKVIEKHFTLNKKMEGWDHSISADPKELRQLCNYGKDVNKLKGSKKIFRVEQKKNLLLFRRSIVASKELSKNKKILFSDLDFKRPGTGLEPIDWKKIVGKRLNKKVLYDDQISLKDIKK